MMRLRIGGWTTSMLLDQATMCHRAEWPQEIDLPEGLKKHRTVILHLAHMHSLPINMKASSWSPVSL